MNIPTIFETCHPRADVLQGAIAEADFAADLAQVIARSGSAEYVDPVQFFANTYPTRGLKNLLANVMRRLSGTGGDAAIFRLDTSYGGGKTHGLIALTHAAQRAPDVATMAEFVDLARLPLKPVRVAAFDGENADPANGRAMGDGILAHTPWGEIAYALAGKAGYERVRPSDENHSAPGADTLRALFGGEPVLILLDELSVYLRKVRRISDAGDQLTAFLTSLFKAVEGAPNAALVYTLALGKDQRATDAYGEEHQFVADKMAEAESVSARKATILNPTEEDETVQVLRRRLFANIDEAQVPVAVDAYRRVWATHGDSLAAEATHSETAANFRLSYPLHPEVLKTLTSKTATLSNFQRVRGMLRLLASTVAQLWENQPADATAIHLHHIDPGYEPVRREIVTRLGQAAYIPAITNDVAGLPDARALAQEIDAEYQGDLPPYAAYLARTIFMHTLAFNDPLKGLSPEQARYSVVGPETDISFVEEVRKKFIAESAYLDDRPGAPMRFLAEANLSQIIRREEQHIDAGEARAELDDRIREIFHGRTFSLAFFPGGPFDVPDEVGDGRPQLAVLSYDALSVGDSVERVPEWVEGIYNRKGTGGTALRALRNHLVLVVADEARKEAMRRNVRRRLALQVLKRPERMGELAAHQQAKIHELAATSEKDLAVGIQQCYRHVFYPSRNRLGGGTVDLAHTALELPSVSATPGSGQQQIVRTLRELNKLRLAEDEPDSPAYIRDRTPLKKGQITTLALRDEFRRDPALPILIGDDLFRRGIRRGIEQGDYIYQRGELLFGPGDPAASIALDEQAFVFTMAYARNKGLWPRPEPTPPPAQSTPAAAEKLGEPPGPSYGSSFVAEGVLKEALIKLWEQVRDRKVEAVGTLTVRMFEARAAFRLLGVVGAVAGAAKTVAITGGYETRAGGSLELEFSGPVPDAQPVREFLEPQLRDARTNSLEVQFQLTFANGLAMQGDAAEKLTERLARFTNGVAHLTATPKVETP